MRDGATVGFYEACDVFRENLPEVVAALRENFDEEVLAVERVPVPDGDRVAAWVSDEVYAMQVRNIAERYQPAIERIDRMLVEVDRPQKRRLSRSDIERARSYPVESLLGAPLRGGYALCPLHSEKTGSFWVNKKKNTWRCFGCQEYGDVIDLYMKLRGVSFSAAVRALL